MANEALWGEEWGGSSANWDADWGEPAFALGSVTLAMTGASGLTGSLSFPTGFALGNLTLAMTGAPGMTGAVDASLDDFWIDAPTELSMVGHMGLAGDLDYYAGGLFHFGSVSLAMTGYSGVAGDPQAAFGLQLGSVALAMTGTPGLEGDTVGRTGTLIAPDPLATVGHLGLQGDLFTVAIPDADFTISPASGTAPLTVSFTGLTAYPATNFLWEYRLDTEWFTFATTQNAQNTFPVGVYDIRFTASNDAGQDTTTKFNCVVVTRALPPDNVFPGWSPVVVPEDVSWTPETPVESEG